MLSQQELDSHEDLVKQWEECNKEWDKTVYTGTIAVCVPAVMLLAVVVIIAARCMGWLT